jgi:tape measure domain-containing protein
MAVELATGYVSLVPSARGFGRKLSGEIGPHLTSAGTSAGDSASRSFASRFVPGVAAAAKRAAFGIGLAMTAAGGFGIKVAADFEQTTIAFEGILGSADEAKKVLGDLRDFAARTPFEFPGLADAAKNLLAVGFATEDILPTMETLGNVAATLGVGENEIRGVVRALGQMKGKGKASAEELQQISEQIPGFSAIKAIAEGMGGTVAEAFDEIAKGAVPADDAIGFILDGMERFPGAAGAMERQSKTLNGVISTFKDTLSTTAIDFITPYLPAISAAVAGFGETVGTFFDILHSGETDGSVIGTVALGVRDAFGLLADVARGVAGVVERFAPTVKGFVEDGLNNLSDWWDRNGDNVQGFFENLGRIFTETLAPALGDLGTFLKDTLLPILVDFATWAIEDGPAMEIAIAAIATALGVYAVNALLAAGATLLSIAPFLLAAVAVGGLSWATQKLIEKFDLLPKASRVAQFFIDNLVVPAADLARLIWRIVDGIQALIDKIPKIPKIPGTGGGGFNPLSLLTVGSPAGLANWLLGREHGGPVMAGHPYIVGEKRPELFVPNTDGTIIPEIPGAIGGPAVQIGTLVARVEDTSGVAIARELRRQQMLVA